MTDLFSILKVSAGAIPTLESGSLFQFGSEQIVALTANVSSLIVSFTPIILISAGLGIGLSIIFAILSVSRMRDQKSRIEKLGKISEEAERKIEAGKEEDRYFRKLTR